LLDIDIQSEIAPEDEALTADEGNGDTQKNDATADLIISSDEPVTLNSAGEASVAQELQDKSIYGGGAEPEKASIAQNRLLATPAVRHMIRGMNISMDDVPGTGKDGRVLKEDVQRYALSKAQPGAQSGTMQAPAREDKTVLLTPIQNQMFKTMTRSLSIPHFLYTDNVDFTSLTSVRRKLNTVASQPESGQPKISSLAFVIKAVSLALNSFPTINAHLDTTSNPTRPQLLVKSSHDIGIAVDSPNGLLVPVIRNVQDRSIISIATEIIRLSALARSNKLTSTDLSGATFSVSNIGSIGGTAVAPVIVSPQVAIVGIGKSRVVPAFDALGQVVKKEECVFSWSADHRVLDGAVVARCAELVRVYLEDVESMAVRLR
jgi:2-oxoisovalerate dehydrogenase E2 component (dihydrolipoyl transacylase)